MSEDCGVMGIHYHLLHYPMTKKEERSVKLTKKLTGWSDEQALEFVRIFYWEIRTTPGGVEPLIKRLKEKEVG